MQLAVATDNIRRIPDLQIEEPGKVNASEIFMESVTPLISAVDNLSSIALNGFKRLEERMHQMVLAQEKTNALLSQTEKQQEAFRRRDNARDADTGMDGSDAKPVERKVDQRKFDFLDFLAIAGLGTGLLALQLRGIRNLIVSFAQETAERVLVFLRSLKSITKVRAMSKLARTTKNIELALLAYSQRISEFFSRTVGLIKKGLAFLNAVIPGLSLLTQSVSGIGKILTMFLRGLRFVFAPLFFLFGIAETIIGARNELENLTSDASLGEKILAGFVGSIKGLYKFLVESLFNFGRDITAWIAKQLGFEDFSRKIKSLDFSFDFVAEMINNAVRNIAQLAIKAIVMAASKIGLGKKTFNLIPESVRDFAGVTFENGEIRGRFFNSSDARERAAERDVTQINKKINNIISTESKTGVTESTQQDRRQVLERVDKLVESDKLSASEASSIRERLITEEARAFGKLSVQTPSALSSMKEAFSLNLSAPNVDQRTSLTNEMENVTSQREESKTEKWWQAPQFIEAPTNNQTNISNRIYQGNGNFETQNSGEASFFGFNRSAESRV